MPDTTTRSRRTPDTPAIPFPVLIADIGGTNVRFAIMTEPLSPLKEFATVQTGDFNDFQSAATQVVLDTTAVLPRALLIALAGPAVGKELKLTNAHWVIEPERILADLALDVVIAFNDFEALALSLPSLRGEQLIQVGAGEPATRSPRVVVGPGTGLGVGALVYGDQCFTPIAGEGGHVALGPESERDFALWPHLERFHGRISAETLLTGDGLARIARGLCALDGGPSDWCRSGADVTVRAKEGDGVSGEAIDLFLTYLGRVAGDLALTFLAKGGVYLGGGVVPRFADRLAKSPFRAAFEAKAPHEAIMATIPTFLILEPRPSVAGMASFATMPERFAVDLTGRKFEA